MRQTGTSCSCLSPLSWAMTERLALTELKWITLAVPLTLSGSMLIGVHLLVCCSLGEFLKTLWMVGSGLREWLRAPVTSVSAMKARLRLECFIWC